MQHGSSLWDYPPTHPCRSSHPPCSANLSLPFPLQPHPPLPSFICFSFKMPPLFRPPRSDFTLTSPILRLTPEQRHFPHFVTSCLGGAAEVFMVHLLYPEPLNSVCVSVKVRRSSPIQWLIELLRSLDGYAASLKGRILQTNGIVIQQIGREPDTQNNNCTPTPESMLALFYQKPKKSGRS